MHRRVPCTGCQDSRSFLLGCRECPPSISGDPVCVTWPELVCWRLLEDLGLPRASGDEVGTPEFGSSAASPCLPSSAGRSRYFLESLCCGGAPDGEFSWFLVIARRLACMSLVHLSTL